MKKLLLLFSLSAFSLGFSQSKDLNKKQALEAFKNSELRKELDIPLSNFDKIYKQAICFKKTYVNKNVVELYPSTESLRVMPIFAKKLDRDNYFADYSFSLYGYGERLPQTDDKGNNLKCTD